METKAFTVRKRPTNLCSVAMEEFMEGIPYITTYKLGTRGITCKEIKFDLQASTTYAAMMTLIEYGYHGDLSSVSYLANENTSDAEVDFFDLKGDIEEIQLVGETTGEIMANNIQVLMCLFNSRYKMDHLRGIVEEMYSLGSLFETYEEHAGMTIYDLAILSGLSSKAIRNLMYSENAPKIKKVNDSHPILYDAKDTYDWLLTRPDFKPSCYIPEEEKVLDTSLISKDGKVLVPVAKDGSYFCDKKCKMAKGYYIGAKGSQECFTDFIDALKELKTLKIPRWRRSNDKGHFGVVTGVNWKWIPENDVLPKGGEI